MKPLTFGSLFAGIGGFDLGFERAGMECKWQVEIDPYCQKVLAKHWPDVRRHDDVRTFPPTDADDWRVDVICGGFPCVDISQLGSRTGIEGNEDGSGLWNQMFRIICVLRPRLLAVENVTDIAFRGLDRVLGDLATSGYDAAWQCLPAAALGAGHTRDRLFALGVDRNANSGNVCAIKAFSEEWWPVNTGRNSAEAWRQAESRMDRIADGVPSRVDRCRSLGNSIVPQVAEWIGRRIVEASDPPPREDK